MLQRLFTLFAFASFVFFVLLAALWLRQWHPFIPHDVPEWEPVDTIECHSTRAQNRAAWEARRNAPDRTISCGVDRIYPEVTFDDVPLDDVIDFIREAERVNIVVHWEAIEAAGIRRTQPVRLKFHNERISTGLARIVNSVGLVYVIDHGEIRVSTRDDLRQIREICRQSWPFPSDDDLQAEATLSGCPSDLPGQGSELPPPRVSLQQAFSAMARACQISVDPKWNELRQFGLTPATKVDPINFRSARDWLEAVLRHESINHDIQYRYRDGTVTVAPRTWFDEEEKPIRRSVAAAAACAAIGWCGMILHLRRRDRRRGALVFATAVILAASIAAVFWLSQATSLQFRILDRRYIIGGGNSDTFELKIRPTALPDGPIQKDIPDISPTFLYAHGRIVVWRVGVLGSEIHATVPCGLVMSLLLMIPVAWTISRLLRVRRHIARMRDGRCVACGYDLRASSGRCPECGQHFLPAPSRRIVERT